MDTPDATIAPGVEAGTPPRRRRRPALACERCRQRKVKCDQRQPCTHCLKARGAVCKYKDNGPLSVPRPRLDVPEGFNGGRVRPRDGALSDTAQGRGQLHPAAPAAMGLWTPAASTPTSDGRGATTAAVSPVALPDRSVQVGPASAEGADGQDGESTWLTSLPAITPLVTKGLMSKTRLFGQSHWINIIALFPMMMRLKERSYNDRESCALIQRCKTLARKIKSRRNTELPRPPLGQALPPNRAVADQLVEKYLSTFEGVYRILHVPSFRRSYEQYCADPSSSDQTFIVTLQLVMAIGASLFDEGFSMRIAATGWVQDAQQWSVGPYEKSRMTIEGLQAMCLILLARIVCGVGGDLLWVNAGALVRTAMYMGLHVDPSHMPKLSPFMVEMRRRLWSTIIELCLQTAADSGGPPLLTMDDFDCLPPLNLDDHDIDPSDGKQEGSLSSYKPKPLDAYTDCSLQIALRGTFAVRLEIVRLLNHFRKNLSYEQTLSLSAELTAACQAIAKRFQGFYRNHNARHRPTPFQLCLVELLVHRLFLVLHRPFLRRAITNPEHSFSRKISVETSLKLATSCGIPGWTPEGAPSPAADRDYALLAATGAGTFRSVPYQALLTIGLELLVSLEEESRLALGGSVAPRADLYGALRAAQDWTISRIKAGETNVKTYMAMVVPLAIADALQAHSSGTGPALEADEMVLEEIVLEKAKHLATVCLGVCHDILRDLVGDEDDDGGNEREPACLEAEIIPDDAMMADAFGMTGGSGEWETGPGWWDWSLYDGQLLRESNQNVDFSATSLND